MTDLTKRIATEIIHIEEGRLLLEYPFEMSTASFYDFRDWLLLILKKMERRVVQKVPPEMPDPGE